MMRTILARLQPLGRALMLPIAVLPVAGMLLRLGQPDLLDIGFVSAAGEAIFNHLGLLFAIGVATGFARDGNGAACLAGVVCFLVATEAAKPLLAVPPDAAAGLTGDAAAIAVAAWKTKAIARLDVPIGMVSGLVGGIFYNRFSTIRLPEYLAFFGGRRFVPIVSGVAGLVIAALVGPAFATIGGAIDRLSVAITEAGEPGLFAFGLVNRLLLVTGLHHLVNNIVWFVVGDWHGATGDLRRFFAGDPSAGDFMSGFFPVMIFGLPAACLAMYHAAPRDRRPEVGGMLFSLALTSALTGVTEPIEFSFMFLAPVLYAIHAVLTGLSMALMAALGVKLGFGFSAGLLDYLLNFGRATRPLLLVPVGAVYAVVYYALFRFFIRRLDLPTPGREPMAEMGGESDSESERGAAFVRALGGAANLETIGACTTRLRLIVRDPNAIDQAALRKLGARGLVRPSPTALQVVLGPMADLVAEEIRGAAALAPATTPARQAGVRDAPLGAAVLSALGGRANVAGVSRHAGRIRAELVSGDVDEAALTSLGIAATARPSADIIHLVADEPTLDRLQVR